LTGIGSQRAQLEIRGQFWVIGGLVGFAATFVTGIAYLAPRTKQLAVVGFDVAMLILIVADMTAKPFS
jgi:hypothetical protein